MLIGYDAGGASSVCAYRVCTEENLTAACLLFGYGTVPHRNAAMTDGIEQSVNAAAQWIVNAIDNALHSEGRRDLRYAATHITDNIHRANDQIRKVSTLTGQGLYVGGVIAYLVENTYLLIPFGGGAAYIHEKGTLFRQAANDPKDGLYRDAIGGSERWQGQYWHGSLLPGNSLFCLTEALSDPLLAASALQSEQKQDDHPNTASMVLRRIKSPAISAVMEIRNSQGDSAWRTTQQEYV